MFSPSLRTDALGLSRRENSQNRSADAIHDLLEWAPPTRSPATPGFHVTRDRIAPGALNRRVIWSGRFWMSDAPVAAWRAANTTADAQRGFRPVSALSQRAAETGAALKPVGPQRGELLQKATPTAARKATSFEELSLEPIQGMDDDADLAVVGRLAELELRVELVKFLKPTNDACGISTGRVLAVSENYSAQDVGRNRVVIHENKALDRPLQPGENVTMAYVNGKASIYDGLAHDVNIVADWMPRDQQGYLRMVMLDALSMLKAPQDDAARLQEALRYALESTANYFGLAETRLRRADIHLIVNERRAAFAPDGSSVESDPRCGPARRTP